MNTTPWGRKESLITPPRAPIYTYAAIALAVLVTLISGYLWTVMVWSRLERFYLPVYIETGVLGVVQKSHSYQLEWTPKLRQANKTHFSANGELCHGSESTEVHARV